MIRAGYSHNLPFFLNEDSWKSSLFSKALFIFLCAFETI